MIFLWAFLVGGAMCALAQLVLDLGRMTPAHVMVLFVVLGGVAAGFGVYEPLVKAAGAGAFIPLPGFGASLVKGVVQDVHTTGLLGAFTGGLKATAAGIKAAVIFALLAAAFSTPRA